MPDVSEARHEMEQAERSIARISKTVKMVAKLFQKMFRMLSKTLDRVFHFSSGERSYKEITKTAVQTGIIENLSKEDLREMKSYAKKWNIKYAIIQTKNDEVQKVNLLTKTKSFFSKEKEKADYCIIYDLKYSEVMTKVLKKVIDARIGRQTSMDPSLRTDFNKDGIVDEKDLDIHIKDNDIKVKDLKLNHEYGTINKSEFKERNHLIYEVSKEDYEKIHLETQVEIQSYSATVIRNLKNEDVVAISISPKHQEKIEDVFLANNIIAKSEMIVNYDKDKRGINPEHCYHIEMDYSEFDEFKRTYKETSFNAYKTNDKWSVIINSDSVKKNFEKNTNAMSLEELYKEIQPSKDKKDIDFEINKEVSVDDLDLSEIDLDIELDK